LKDLKILEKKTLYKLICKWKNQAEKYEAMWWLEVVTKAVAYDKLKYFTAKVKTRIFRNMYNGIYK
jgi:hypothetical protein